MLMTLTALILSLDTYAQEAKVSLLDDVSAPIEKNKAPSEKSASDDELFNFLGIKIPNFISSSKEQGVSLFSLQQKAESGDVKAQLQLGYTYLYGSDKIEKDYQKAFHYYSLAAKQEDKIGLNNLGSMYYNGIGVKRDTKIAALLFAKATEKGNTDAAANLGIMYITGNGIEKNVLIGLNYLEQAAEQNNNLAQYILGCAYYYGHHREINHSKAAQYIKNAADAGFDEAQLLLATIYMQGLGFTQNYANAVKYLHQSAAQGNISAMIQLAEIYISGNKYPVNISNAHIFYNLAAARGVTSAGEKRQLIESKMKIEEVLNAQNTANNFKEKLSAFTNYVHNTIGKNICNNLR